MLSFNRLAEKQDCGIASQIEGYIDRIKSRYRININFHDLSGVSSMDTALEAVLAPYLYHNNCFCNYVKKNEACFEKCIENKNKLCAYCKKRMKPFYGRCYMGVEEFVFPVACEGNVIAVICIGQFARSVERTLRSIKRMSGKYAPAACEAAERFLEIAREPDFSAGDLFYDVGILCSLISSMYLNFIGKNAFIRFDADEKSHIIRSQKDNFVINNTISFIKENYGKELSLKILASNSYCNSSYLSHIFKEKMDLGITDYINRIRVEAARQLLDVTARSVTDICMAVGYNDSGYFSRVFRKHTGVSPSEYRLKNS